MPTIQAHGLERKFGSFAAVDGLSFEVDEGEVFGLLGPNGAGKTTTIRLLTCLISPTADPRRSADLKSPKSQQRFENW